MSVSVNPPKTPLTKGSNGIAMATLPNICKMPGPPAPFIPTPLPNIGKTGDSPKGYSKKVKIEGNTVGVKGASFKSVGDMASKGTGGGLISSNTHGPCKFISPGSMDVKIQGKNVHLLTDMVTNNGGPSGSPPNSATLMGAIQKSGVVYVLREGDCPICGAKDHDDFEESQETKDDAQDLVDAYKDSGAWKSKMIGVVHCQEGHKYTSTSKTGQDQRFINIAKNDYHIYPTERTTEEGDKIRMTERRTTDRMGELLGNPLSFRRAVTQADFAREIQRHYQEKINDPDSFAQEEEIDEARISRNVPGACAAQKALLWALEHDCTPSAMTEKWFSPGRPAAENISKKDPEPTAPVRHIDMRDPDIPIEVPLPFGHEDSVPPCETCNLLLPFLTCTKPNEGSCGTGPDDCVKCRG